MRNSIQLQNRFIFFYSNPAGYLEQDHQTAVMDPMFQNQELEAWLRKKGYAVKWQDGVYDRLAEGSVLKVSEGGEALKALRVYQLRPSVGVEIKFLELSRLQQMNLEPTPDLYDLVYDGMVGTNDLEQIFEKFRFASPGDPPGFMGNPMSKSDVVELYDETGSSFFYNDKREFIPISFGRNEEEAAGMSMSM